MQEDNNLQARYGELLPLDSSFEQDFTFPFELMQISDDDASAIIDQSKKLMSVMLSYKEMMMMYACALKEIRTRFEILNTEFSVRHRRNPITSINTRLKRTTSIVEKMQRRSIPFSIENMKERVDDMAGIRVICSYTDDIYQISQALTHQTDIELITQKDYIAKPKPNGYRSLHMIVRVPVFFENRMERIKVEVQIRTIAMDFWASLEHELRYKKQLTDSEEIPFELKECAEIISEAETRMLHIRKRIDGSRQAYSKEDELLEQLRRIDHPLT